jgi:invasion protein IalB
MRVGGFLAAAALAGAAYAQAPRNAPIAPPPQLPPSAQPQGLGSTAQGNDAGPITTELRSHPALPDWTKICGKDQAGTESCYTTRDFVSNEGQPALAISVHEATSGPHAGSRLVRFVTPLALLIQPGIRFATESGQGTAARYTICFPTGCFAEAAVRDDLINVLKKATTLKVAVQNHAGREVIFSVPLEGFGRAHDGPPIEPEALRKQQEAFVKETERRAEEIRRKALEQGQALGRPMAK